MGNSETSFIMLNRVRRMTVEMRMVKSGVEARTTWWNCERVSEASSPSGEMNASARRIEGVAEIMDE